MDRALTCPSGHRWNSAAAAVARVGLGLCPYCGKPAIEPGAQQSARPNENRAPAPLPPPPPLPAVPKPSTMGLAGATRAARGLGAATTVVPQPLVSLMTPVPAQPPAPAQASPEMQWAKVDVAPSLPMTTFTSTERWHAERIGALAIYCSDGRWGDAFDEFCHRSLNIPRYDRFAVPGGPAWINQINTDLPDLYRAAHGQLEYLVRSHELDRIVLITHYACGFYHERHHLEADACIPVQTEDVKKAAQTLRQWFKDVKIESYLAMRQGNVLSFHRLEA